MTQPTRDCRPDAIRNKGKLLVYNEPVSLGDNFAVDGFKFSSLQLMVEGSAHRVEGLGLGGNLARLNVARGHPFEANISMVYI